MNSTKPILILVAFLTVSSLAQAKLYINPVKGTIISYDKNSGKEIFNADVYKNREKINQVTSIEFDTIDNKILILDIKFEPKSISDVSFFAQNQGKYNLLSNRSLKLKPLLEKAIKSESDYYIYVDKNDNSLASETYIYDSRLDKLSQTSEFEIYTVKEKAMQFYDSLSIPEKANEVGKKVEELIKNTF